MIFILFAVTLIFLIFPLEFAVTTRDALNMCINSVVPSLFHFAVISRLIVLNLKGGNKNPFLKIVKKTFNLSTCGAISLILGFICGYPVGAKSVCELLREEKIKKEEAKRLLLYCNNAGPAFTVATVGGMFAGSVKTGVIIYISHIISSIFIGILLSFGKKITDEKYEIKSSEKFSQKLVSAILESMIAVINVSGIIVFFSALLHIFDVINLSSLLPHGFLPVLKGMFEITGGIKELYLSSLPYNVKVALSSFLVSFSGVSVFFQVKMFSDDINILPMAVAKFVSGIIACIVTFIII